MDKLEKEILYILEVHGVDRYTDCLDIVDYIIKKVKEGYNVKSNADKQRT